MNLELEEIIKVLPHFIGENQLTFEAIKNGWDVSYTIPGRFKYTLHRESSNELVDACDNML